MKRNILTAKLVILACMSVMTIFAGCNKEDDIIIDREFTLKLSDDTYTFDHNSDEEFIIDVTSLNGQWEVEYEDSADTWIKYETAENSVKITVEPNNGIEPRSGNLKFTAQSDQGNTITATAAIKQLGYETDPVKFRLLEYMENGIISPDGKWVVFTQSYLNAYSKYEYIPHIFNTETTEYTVGEGLIEKQLEYVAVDNNGNLVVTYGGVYTKRSALLRNGALEAVATVQGYEDRAVVSSVSGDGRIMVGYSEKEIDWFTSERVPVKWTDGVPEILELPENNASGDPRMHGGMATGCSADGSVIYGVLGDDGTAIYWKNGEVSIVAPESITKEIVEARNGMGELEEYIVLSRPIGALSVNGMSPNGKYLAVTYSTAKVENEELTEYVYPSFFNIETGELLIYDDLIGLGLTINNDGTGFSIDEMMTVGQAIDVAGKTHQGIPEWLKQKFGITLAYDLSIIWQTSDNPNVVVGSNSDITMIGTKRHFWYAGIPGN